MSRRKIEWLHFKRRIRNYKKRRPTISFIPPKVNAFSANGITVGFIPTTEVSTGISRSAIIRLIHFRQKSVGLILTMRFRYGMCMCIGIKIHNSGVCHHYCYCKGIYILFTFNKYSTTSSMNFFSISSCSISSLLFSNFLRSSLFNLNQKASSSYPYISNDPLS